MKRTAAILLLLLLCFNWIGYQFLNAYLESRANTVLEAQLDQNNYDESELISIKVAAPHFAYSNTSAQFERIDGQVEVNGIQYKYVKRRFVNDSLEMLCIPNHTAMQLRSAKDEFFKLVNDLQHQTQGKKAGHQAAGKTFSPDVYTTSSSFIFNETSFDINQQVPSHYIVNIPVRYFTIATPPPDLA